MDEQQRATMMALADVLIPADGEMPNASAADPKGEWLDRALKARPDLASVLPDILASAAGRDPSEELRRLQRELPKAYVVLATIAGGAYYMAPEVMRRIGYAGQKPTLPDPDEADNDLRDGILDPVVARGAIYRPTPR